MKWQPGESGNPDGRPKGPKSELAKLREAVREVEARRTIKAGRPISLYVHFVDRAFKDDTVLTALAKKLVPDLKQIDGSIERKSLSLIGITLDPDVQALVSAFIGKLARLELDKERVKLPKLAKKGEIKVIDDDSDAQDCSGSTEEEEADT